MVETNEENIPYRSEEKDRLIINPLLEYTTLLAREILRGVPPILKAHVLEAPDVGPYFWTLKSKPLVASLPSSRGDSGKAHCGSIGAEGTAVFTGKNENP